ncbi:MAG: FGGY family carbohydrate kinase, partial [Oscillospiraceae bacterium]
YQHCGLRLDPYFSLPKMLWFKNNEPEIWKQTHKLIGVQDYLCFLLTGKYVTDRSQACRTMLLDIRNFQWNSELLNLVGIEREKLCDLCDAGGVAGEFSSPFAKRVSIPAGIPVLLCGGDQQCAALALGLFEKGTATANTGTGSFVLGYADRPTFDAQQRVLCSAAAIPGQWIVEAGIYASGATYNWCRRELFDPQHGDQQTTFETVNEQVKKVPAGSNGVLVMPHFSGSAAPNWNPLAKGIVFNLGLGSTRAEICRATLEGIAGEIADNIELIASIAGKIKCVYVAGGLTRSSEYCQIMSDNLGRVVVRRKNPEAAFMGCLMSACVTLGIYKDYREAFDNIAIEESEQFHPDPERGKVYGKARMLKRALYKSLDENGIYKMAYGS